MVNRIGKAWLGAAALILTLSGCGGGGGGGGSSSDDTVVVYGLAYQQSDALADAGTVVTVNGVSVQTVSPPKANTSSELYNFMMTVPRTAVKGTFTQGSTVNDFPLTATPNTKLPTGELYIGKVYVGSSSGICKVTGRVVNSKSEVISGAQVSIGNFSVTTGSDGTFTFEQAPAWFSSITIAATGYTKRAIVLDSVLVKDTTNTVGDLRFEDDISDDPPSPPWSE